METIINATVIGYLVSYKLISPHQHGTLLSFPPHCSHQLQPLDKAVYGPFKTNINAASDNWVNAGSLCPYT